MKLEYGVAEYSPSMVYRQDAVTYGPRPNDASKGGGIVTNEFNASASLTLPSGNRINLDFSYKEELLVDRPCSIGKDPFETLEEYEARLDKVWGTAPKSESDYRSLAIQDTEITLSLLDNQHDLKIQSEPVSPVSQSPIVKEFFAIS